MRTDKLEKMGSSSKYNVSYFHNPNKAVVVIVDVGVWDVSCECHLKRSTLVLLIYIYRVMLLCIVN